MPDIYITDRPLTSKYRLSCNLLVLHTYTFSFSERGCRFDSCPPVFYWSGPLDHYIKGFCREVAQLAEHVVIFCNANFCTIIWRVADMGLIGLENRASGETLRVRFLYSPFGIRFFDNCLSSNLREIEYPFWIDWIPMGAGRSIANRKSM